MNKLYLCFTRDHDQDAARRAFFEKYHCQPAELKIAHGILWVGPIPGSDQPAIGILFDAKDQHDEPMQLLML